jgi:Icc-related predicted phosphoesterase
MTLNIQVCSDLHIEYKNDQVPEPLDYITPNADILVLAGDIGSFYKIEQLKGFLEKLCPLFKTVIYVPGNQEYYTVNNINTIPMYRLLNNMYDIEQNIKNLYVLNQTSLIINDICITGCTLWSDLKIGIPKFIVRIYGISNEIYEKKYISDVNYIKKMIDYCNEKNLKLVVITHYCPTYKVLDGCNKRDKYVSLYTSNLDDLLDSSKIHTWICGHIHKNFDFLAEKGTRIVGNQLGKPKDNIKDFKKDFIIQI